MIDIGPLWAWVLLPAIMIALWFNHYGSLVFILLCVALLLALQWSETRRARRSGHAAKSR